MSMSIMLTSNPEDIDKIKSTILCLDFISSLSEQSVINISDVNLTHDDILSLKKYYSNILNVLNTKSMTIEDYEDSLKYI